MKVFELFVPNTAYAHVGYVTERETLSFGTNWEFFSALKDPMNL